MCSDFAQAAQKASYARRRGVSHEAYFLYAAVLHDDDNEADGIFQQPANSLGIFYQ
jgi:hypothetical protein